MSAALRRRLLLAVLAPPVLGGVVLGVEVELARRGPDLGPAAPFVLDRELGGGGPPLRMVWLGDSTAAGVGASAPDQALPVVVARELDGAGRGGGSGRRAGPGRGDEQGRAVRLTVLAESGARVADVVREQAPRVAALDPDVVLVSVGANDATHLTRRGRLRRDYRRLLSSVGARAGVVALGVPDMGSPTRLAQPLRAVAGWRGRAVDAVIRDVVREHPGVTYVDIAGSTGPSFRRDPARYFAADRYHPGDAGYRLWADAVVPAVRDLL